MSSKDKVVVLVENLKDRPECLLLEGPIATGQKVSTTIDVPVLTVDIAEERGDKKSLPQQKRARLKVISSARACHGFGEIVKLSY